MKIYLNYFFILFFFHSCTKTNDKVINRHSNYSKDSLSVLLYKIENKNTSVNDKIKFGTAAFNILKLKSNDSISRLNLLKVVKNFNDLNEWGNLFETNKLLFKNANNTGDGYNIANSYYYSANYYYNNQIHDSAYYYYSKAEKNYLKINDKSLLGDINLKKSFVLLDIKDFFGAEYCGIQSLTYFKLFKDKLSQYDAYTALGIITNESQDYLKSLEYHNSALDISNDKTLDKFFLKEISLNNIGNTYQSLKKYDKSIVEFNKALSNNKLKMQKPSLYASLLDNIAYSKFKTNTNDGVLNLFLKSLKIRDSLKLDTKIIFSKIHLSEYYLHSKDYQNSIKYAVEALVLSRNTNSPLDILASLKQISYVDKQKSAAYSKEYFKLSDSLQVAERNSKNRFARIQFETNEITKERDKLVDINKGLYYFFIVSGLLLSLIVFVRYQRNRARELVFLKSQQRASEEIYNLMVSQQTAIEETRINEKMKIARDLHDGILGRLFGARLNLDSMNGKIDNDAIEGRKTHLNELKIIEQDLREISHDLNREKTVLINNFVTIVNSLLKEQNNMFPPTVIEYIDSSINWDKVNNIIKINFYRILQEVLQNINKYANASTIEIQLIKDENQIKLFIIDNGIGFDVDSNSNGIGIQNIISRIKEVNGEIEIISAINEGTKIAIVVPLEKKRKPKKTKNDIPNQHSDSR